MSTFEPGTFGKYKALVFDCYGTLIDWETGIYDGLHPLFVEADYPSDRRSIITAFHSVERDLQAQFPSMRYSDILARVYRALEARLQNKELPPSALHDDNSQGTVLAPANSDGSSITPIDSAPVGSSDSAQHSNFPDAAEAFAYTVGAWPPFPDTVPALASLSKRFKLIILSNIDHDSIARTCALLEGTFTLDAVYTAEDVGAYKPAPEMLSYALAHLKDDFGITQEEVLMTAQSVFHDIIPARARGLATAWINRLDAISGLEGVKGDEAMFTFSTLGAMAEAVEKADV